MSINFPLLLITLALISGCIALVDRICWEPKRHQQKEITKPPLVAEYARSFFPIFILVLIIRSFIAQFYWVPTGSLEPTIDVGELLLVTQYNYNIHFPLWNKPLFYTGKVHRGDIAVFHWPVNRQANLIKRIIGLPGDKISYVNKVLTINGIEMKQTFVSADTDTNDNKHYWPVNIMEENLNGLKHEVYVCSDKANCPNQTPHDFYNLTVPENEYFVMGDNRDDSDDSRHWGFVPAENLIGKARVIVGSWDSEKRKIRWGRMGTAV